MKILSIIKTEVSGWEKWFKISLFLLLLIYTTAWIWTMKLAHDQALSGYTTILPVVVKDSSEYAALSESLGVGSFSLNGTPETYRVPGYPSFVLIARNLFGGSYFGVTFIQIILVFVSALFLRKIGKTFFSSTAGGIAALLLVANPVVLVSALTIMTDTVFLFLFIFGFYLVSTSSTREKPIFFIFIGGVLFSISIYIRAMGLFAIPIFLAPILLTTFPYKKKTLYALTVIAITATALTPWMYRNYITTGVFSYSSFKAFNLTYYTVPMFMAWENRTTEEVERTIVEKNIGVPLSQWRDLRFSKQMDKYVTGILLIHPISYLAYHSIVSLPFLFSSSVEFAIREYRTTMDIPMGSHQGAIRLLAKGDVWHFAQAMMEDWWKLVERLILLTLYVFTVLGAWANRRSMSTWVFIFVAAYLMLLAGPASNARYAIQAQPFIFMLSSYYLTQKSQKQRGVVEQV